MAIRLSLDLSGATCGELMRFADAVRSAGVSPHQPIERSGPDRIEVSMAGGGPDPGARPESHGRTESYGPEAAGRAESYGPESYGPPFHRPPGRPGPGGPPGHPGFSGPAPRPVGPQPPYPPGPASGLFPPPDPYTGWPPGVPFHVTTHYVGPRPTQGGYISVQRGEQMFAAEVSTETVERWKAALSEALKTNGLSEAARGPLLELRALLNMEGLPRRSQ